MVILRNHNFAVVEDIYAGDRQGFFGFTSSTVRLQRAIFEGVCTDAKAPAVEM